MEFCEEIFIKDFKIFKEAKIIDINVSDNITKTLKIIFFNHRIAQKILVICNCAWIISEDNESYFTSEHFKQNNNNIEKLKKIIGLNISNLLISAFNEIIFLFENNDYEISFYPYNMDNNFIEWEIRYYKCYQAKGNYSIIEVV